MIKSFVLLALVGTLALATPLPRDPKVCLKIPAFVSFLTDNCTFKNVCINGQLISQPYECAENSRCGLDANGNPDCICQPGMQWNAQRTACFDPNNPPKPRDPNAPCPDKDSGLMLTPGYSQLTNGCKYLKLCLNGEIHTQCHTCPKNTFCGTEGKYEACICEGKFKWDANKKNCIAK
ncbi:hypothetical protein L596_009016 [Steinernema carpocapsae]|uniref:TIL domain-containing protein n=1 Tax=Steinernema carpocapsae TaxID=34508 RepID=A0A4U5PEH7_STECR|nr:hypothetical protein L596_009016 [Steinernema carpocapsae]